MIYGSVCSGIESASVAWAPLKWKCAFLSEINPFPRAVLQHRFPYTPLHGDFRTIEPDTFIPIDLLVGGTPCQRFSRAGLRLGMKHDRENLALEFVRLTARLRPNYLLWENVEGVLSSNGGMDFGSLIGALGECGYSLAWRVFDAQDFGLPQHRARVFVLGYSGTDLGRVQRILFNTSGLQEHSQKRQTQTEETATNARTRSARSSQPDALALNPKITHTLTTRGLRHCGADEQLIVCDTWNDDITTISPSLHTQSRAQLNLGLSSASETHVLRSTTNLAFRSERYLVRRATPRECERLMGLPDDWTDVPFEGKPAPDWLRFRAIGNAMAVPCVRWIGERIEQDLLRHKKR